MIYQIKRVVIINDGQIVIDDSMTNLKYHYISFWFGKSDMIADTGNSLMTNFATYPDGIFKGISRILLLTVIPVGLTSYFPVWIMTEFNLMLTLVILFITVILTTLTFIVFYKGLRRYSSSNLMISKI